MKPPSQPPSVLFTLATVTTAVLFALHIAYIFFATPIAQPAAGGLAQKIFYFHVPSAYALYLSGAVCFLGSAFYLVRGDNRSDAWARAGAETAVLFGAMVMTSGPLWAKRAWGVYWTWDPRLTTLLLSVLLYIAMVLLRNFAGDGAAERRFSAAFGVLGTVLLPIVHKSVQLWGGNHPTVVGKGGGGLGSSSMKIALSAGFFTMTLLAGLLLVLRMRLAFQTSRLVEAEELAASLGYGDDEDDASNS